MSTTTYTRISTDILRELGAAAAIISGQINGNNNYYPCASKAGELTGTPVSTASRAVAALAEHDYITRCRQGWAATDKLHAAVDAGWLEIPTSILRREDITAKDKALYAYLAGYSDHSEQAVSAATGLSGRDIRRHLPALEQAGLIFCDTAGGGRGRARHFCCSVVAEPVAICDEDELAAREEYAWQLSVGAANVPADITAVAVDGLVWLDSVPTSGVVRVGGEDVPAHQAWEYARLADGYTLTAVAERIKAAWDSVRDKQAYLLSALLAEGRRVYIDIEGHDVPPLRVGKAVVA